MTTNELFTDVGFVSLNHAGEQLCGDHVEIVSNDAGMTAVLADGLGSGVKASILSTLTAKIMSTMLSSGISLEETVGTMADTLPVSPERGVAYSTFSVIHIVNGEKAELIQYDNPEVILLRGGKSLDIPYTTVDIAGKKIRRSEIPIEENDIFVLFSDGVEHAGVGISFNFGWERRQIADYMAPFWNVGFTAKTLSTLLIEETDRLYGGNPGDDATALCLRVRRRSPVNLVIGPPANRDDGHRMMSLFFGKAGKHIVCGGTTSSIAAKYLQKPLQQDLTYLDPEIPPTASLQGADLVTEGVITINKVLAYAKDYLQDNKSYEKWAYKKDGASQIARLLFEEATDINFFVGKAVNPAHQSRDLPINFTIKMQLVEELAACLKKMGKRIMVNYF